MDEIENAFIRLTSDPTAGDIVKQGAGYFVRAFAERKDQAPAPRQ